MKYLKLFKEDLNSEYSICDPGEFHNSPGDMFTERDIKLIKDFTILNNFKSIFNNEDDTMDQYFTINLSENGGRINKEYPGVSIIKSLDEWFYMGIVGSDTVYIYYKCDQVEGLISCLNDCMSVKK